MPQPLRIRELSTEEHEKIQSAMAAFCYMIEELGIDPDAEELDTPDLAEILVANWRRQPKGDRYSPETLATILGAATGDFLRHYFDVDWRVVSDEEGTSVCLYSAKAGGANDLVVAIFDSIRKRLETTDEDFVVEFLEELAEDMQPLAHKKRGAQNDR